MLVQQGEAAERGGRLDEAYRAYAAAFQQDPSDRGALLGLTRIAGASGNYGDLPHRLAWLIHQSPWDFEAIELLLECDPGALAKIIPSLVRTRAASGAPGRGTVNWTETAHSYDRRLLTVLSQSPAVTQVVAEQQAKWADASFKRQMLLESVRVGPHQMPRVWELVVEGSQRLGVSPPECFVASTRKLNAYAAGAMECFLVLTTRLLDVLTDEELLFVIGHELGHMVHHHVLYYQVAEEIAKSCFRSAAQAAAVADAFAVWGGTVGGIGSLLASASVSARVTEAQAVALAVLRWQQYAEFSADRAGLVACRSVGAATSALTKISGLAPALTRRSRFAGEFNLEAFLEQYDEAARQFAHLTPAEDYLRSHPYTAHRIRSIQAWQASWAYHCLLSPGGTTTKTGLGEFAL